MIILVLKVESKSKAKILGKRVKSYLVGQDFEVTYRIENIGDGEFAGGIVKILISWPNGQGEITPYTIPLLKGGDERPLEPSPSTWGVLSRGFALFSLLDAKYHFGRPITIYKDEENQIPMGKQAPAFYSVLGKEPEEIYEFWGMIISAIALVILVGDKIIQFLKWFLPILYTLMPT